MVLFSGIFIVLNIKNKYSEKEKQGKLEEEQVKLKILIGDMLRFKSLGYRGANRW